MTDEQNFKKGDRVAITTDKNRIVGTITNVGRKYYHITLDNGCKTMAAKENVEPYDRRTAFLTRLQLLLREYDARICDGEGYMVIIELDSQSDKSERLFFELIYQDYITADNIMDFDKE